MRRSFSWLTVVLMASLTVSIWAQKPDFSGKWTTDQQKTGPLGNPFLTLNGYGGTFALKVDANTLTRTTVMNDGKEHSTVYKLDGREGILPGSNGNADVTYTAKWDGNTIAIETTTTSKNGIKAARHTVYSLEGQWLVISGGTKEYFKKTK